MTLFDILVRTYSNLHGSSSLLSPIRYAFRGFANWFIPIYFGKTKHKNNSPTIPVVVSLTSFPARINIVWQVIECMLRQTLKPSKIILWLSEEQFMTEDTIPYSLKHLMGDVFEIRMVKGDIRSHKKYYYVAKEYPNSMVFLIDDDIYYARDILERSYNAIVNNPNCVVCNYGYKISNDAKGKRMPYNKWKHVYTGACGDDLFFGSGGGTLLRPSSLYKDLTNIELALKLTPLADDIWLNTMARLAKQKILLLPSGLFLPMLSKSEMLYKENRGQAQNDLQIGAIEGHYNIKIF